MMIGHHITVFRYEKSRPLRMAITGHPMAEFFTIPFSVAAKEIVFLKPLEELFKVKSFSTSATVKPETASVIGRLYV